MFEKRHKRLLNTEVIMLIEKFKEKTSNSNAEEMPVEYFLPLLAIADCFFVEMPKTFVIQTAYKLGVLRGKEGQKHGEK